MRDRLFFGMLAAYVAGAAVWVIQAGVVRDGGGLELLNVACDPTRELWHDLNARFLRRYHAEHGVQLCIRQSHGGSGSQARAVIDGLAADVVTLALWTDTDAVRRRGLIGANWEDRLPNRSLPFVSTIVFVVRRGNPKAIRDWPDLVRGDVTVVTPNPKTSGNGKWSFLAAWGSVVWAGGGEDDAERFVRELYRRVPVLDTSARAATMTFSQKGIGDVHLTWENEAHLEVAESNGALEIVAPPRSVLAEPHVAWVDAVVRRKRTRAAAEAYLNFLYTDEAQDVIARHHYRPTRPEALARHAGMFPAIALHKATTLAEDWDAIHKRFFAEGALFDRLFAGGQ